MKQVVNYQNELSLNPYNGLSVVHRTIYIILIIKKLDTPITGIKIFSVLIIKIIRIFPLNELFNANNSSIYALPRMIWLNLSSLYHSKLTIYATISNGLFSLGNHPRKLSSDCILSYCIINS